MAEQTTTESLRVKQLKQFLGEEIHYKLFSDSHSSQGKSWGDCPVLAQLLGSFVDSCQSHRIPHAFGLLPGIALRSHPSLPLQTTAQVADVVLRTGALQNQKINSAVHRLLPASTSQLLTCLQRKVTELNQEKLPSSLPENHKCISHECIEFCNQQVDEPYDCDEPENNFSPIGLESSPANQLQEQEASLNNALLPHSQKNEQEPKMSISLETLFKPPIETNTHMSPLQKQNSTEMEPHNKPDIVLVHQAKQQDFLLPAVKSHGGQDYEQQQARKDLSHTLHFDSSLLTDTEAARRRFTRCTSGLETIMDLEPILPEQCSTPMTAVPATNLVGGQAPAVATFTSMVSPCVATIASTVVVIATAPPTVATPTLTAAAAVTTTATSSFPPTHAAVTSNLGSEPVSNSSTTAASVVQQGLMLYACWKELLSNQQLEATSLGLAGTSFGPALMKKFGGPQQVEALATQAEALLEKALEVSALQCRPSLIRPLLEVLEYNRGPNADLARLRLFLRHHHSLPEAQRAGLHHVLAHHPHNYRLQLHTLQNLQQLCPGDDSVLLLAQTLLDHPNAFGYHQFFTPGGDLDTPTAAHIPSASRSTNETRSETIDTNTADCSASATRSETVDTNTAGRSTSATRCASFDTNTVARSTSTTTMSSSRAQPKQSFSTLAQTPSYLKDTTADSSNTDIGHKEKIPGVIDMDTSSTGATARKTVEGKSKNKSVVGARTKCLLQKECVVQSTVCAVRVLVRLLQFPQWHAVLRPWQLLRRAFVLLHTSWIRCWQCSGCRWSREAVASLVTVFWLAWWRQRHSPGHGITDASNISAASGTGTVASNCRADRNSASTSSTSSGAGNSCASPGATAVASSRHGVSDFGTSSGTVTRASHSSALSATVTSAPNSSNVFFSADSGGAERFSGSRSSTALEACSSLNSSSVAELAMHRAVVAHILCIDDDCGKWCDALRRGGWLNMAKELKDTVGARGPFKESFKRYRRTLLYRRSMLFAGSLDAGEKTLLHASAPGQACNTQLTRPPDMSKDSVLCKSTESLYPYLKTGSQPGAKDLAVESSVREDHPSCNASSIECSSTALLDDPSAPAAADTEALHDSSCSTVLLVGESSLHEDHQSCNVSNIVVAAALLDNPPSPAAADPDALVDSSCSTVIFNDDHLLPEFYNRNECQNVNAQGSRMPRRTVFDRLKHTGKHLKYLKKHDSLDSDKHEDRKNASHGVADKSSANSSSGASKDEPMIVEDNDLDHQENVGISLKPKKELLDNLQHRGGTRLVSSRDCIETTYLLSPSNDSKVLPEKDCGHSQSLTGWQKSPSAATHCGIEVVTEEVKEETISDGENKSLAARNYTEDRKLKNWSIITDHKSNAPSKINILKSSTNMVRPSYEIRLFPVSVDDHAADSSLARPLKQTDGPNSAVLDGKRNIASEQCSFSSNTEESNGMLHTEVNEIISSLESPPATKRRKRDGENSAVDPYCEPLSVDDEHNESSECSSDFESYPKRDAKEHLRRGAIKRKRPIGEMFPKQKADKTGFGKMDLGLVMPCFVRLNPLGAHKFVTSRNTRLKLRPTQKQ